MVRCQYHEWNVRGLLISDKLGLKFPSSHIPESRTLPWKCVIALFWTCCASIHYNCYLFFTVVNWHHSWTETWLLLLEARVKLQFLHFRCWVLFDLVCRLALYGTREGENAKYFPWLRRLWWNQQIYWILFVRSSVLVRKEPIQWHAWMEKSHWVAFK